MTDPNRVIPGDDDELHGVCSLAANWLLMAFSMGSDANPEDALNLPPNEVEGLILGRLQDIILNVQQQEHRSYTIGKDLPIIMEKVQEQSLRWLHGDFR